MNRIQIFWTNQREPLLQKDFELRRKGVHPCRKNQYENSHLVVLLENLQGTKPRLASLAEMYKDEDEVEQRRVSAELLGLY